MNLRIFLLTLGLCLIGFSSSLYAAEIYKVINSDGSISYSDQPFDEATANEVTLPEIFILPSVDVPTVSVLGPAPTPDLQSKSVRIHSPLNEDVIRGSDNRLSIVVSVSPTIGEDERLQLLHNGEPYGPAQSSGQWNLARLLPGTQKFSVQLVSTTGESRGQSSTVTIYVIL